MEPDEGHNYWIAVTIGLSMMATLTIAWEEMGESIHVICDDDDRGSRYDKAEQLSLIRELYILYIYSIYTI